MSRQALGGSKKPTTNSAVAHNGAPMHSVEVKPNLEAVRRRAYELYLERVRIGAPGNETVDWVKAEQELSGRK